VAQPVEVSVRASAKGFDALGALTRQFGRNLVAHAAHDDGASECTLTFESLDDAYVDLMPLAADVEVVEPASLRMRVLTTANAAVALYA
jgi:predicted DNA-binding transcriptional regulator YafY